MVSTNVQLVVVGRWSLGGNGTVRHDEVEWWEPVGPVPRVLPGGPGSQHGETANASTVKLGDRQFTTISTPT